MKNSTKYKIAKIMSNGLYYGDNPTYEQLIESIYENVYVSIYKVPSNTFILGTIESFIINDLDKANMVLSNLKEVVQEALEFSGIELTYPDDDWATLKIINNTDRWGSKFKLSKNSKSYIGEYFDI